MNTNVYLESFEHGLATVLRIDPSLKPVIDRATFASFRKDTVNSLPGSFEYLVRSVLSQQVSGHAAKAICYKFLQLFNGGDTNPEEDTPSPVAPPSLRSKFPSPAEVLTKSVEELRAAGLSYRKSEYVRSLAEAYEREDLSDQLLKTLSDDEVADRIVSVRGLGPWTAQMFLLFWLHRMDIFSPADIGVQRGFRTYMRAHYPPDHTEVTQIVDSPGKSKKARARTSLPDDIKHMEHVAARFAPYRSAFQMVLWQLASINLDTIEVASYDSTTSNTGSVTPKNISKVAKEHLDIAREASHSLDTEIMNAVSKQSKRKPRSTLADTDNPMDTTPKRRKTST